MLSSKGMIISDNVLFKGHVATDLAEVETRRRRSLIKNSGIQYVADESSRLLYNYSPYWRRNRD